MNQPPLESYERKGSGSALPGPRKDVLLGICHYCQRYTRLTAKDTCNRRYCQRLAKHARGRK